MKAGGKLQPHCSSLRNASLKPGHFERLIGAREANGAIKLFVAIMVIELRKIAHKRLSIYLAWTNVWHLGKEQ